ncbi:cell division protein FtsL [Atopomonas hussainii]|uniref:cell division protein FtsL n=1 Tax=Atopomonas hussainii TaxID=1429083 RepID=UPI0009002B13|nr:cell division protein FtsL [Atopomonas hussainii]
MNAQKLAGAMPNGSLLLLVLFVLVLGSSIAVAYTQHWNRLLLNDLFGELSVRDRALAEWGRLVLEQSTWTSHARIETLAAGQLGMQVPAAVDVQLVKP